MLSTRSNLPCRGSLFSTFFRLFFRSFYICSLAVLSAVSQNAWANGNPASSASVDELVSMSLEELLNYEVVAPTKSDTRLSDAPGAVSVITYDQIRNSAAKTIPELLRRLPGIHVRWNPMVQSIEIRSFGSNPFTSKVLLLIDGIPYNSWNKGGFPQHPGFDFFNLENVKHIEVIRGGGSALYGENALNGVINIVTLSGREYQQTRGSVYTGNRGTRSVTVSHGSSFGEGGSIFLSVRSEKSQLPNEFWNDQKADAEGQDLFIKGQYKGLQLSYYRRQDKFDGFDANVGPPVADYGFRSVEEIAQDINIIAAKFDHKTDDKAWSFEANLSYADRDGTACGGCHAESQSPEFNKKIDHGYQAFGNVQFGYHKLANHDFLIGAEMRKLSAGDSFDQVPIAHGGAEVTEYKKPAIFVQDKISVLNDRLQIVAGLRYDRKTSPDLFDNELFPRIATIAKPNDKLTLRAGWSRAARYPSFTELYQNVRFFGAESLSTPGSFLFPPTDFQPNPDLKAETINSVEAGIEYQLNRTMVAKIDFYHNEIEDPLVMVYNSPASTIGFENHANSAKINGFEVEFRADVTPSTSTYINWSYQDNEQDSNNTDSAGLPIEFSYSPKHKINWGLTARIGDNFSATLEASWRDSFTGPSFWNNVVFGSPEVRELDDYMLINLQARYRVPMNVGHNQNPITINIYGKDLGNEAPFETLVGGDARLPGREFFIGIDYEWAN